MCAVHNTAVFFCSSLISCFPGMLLRYCLSDFEMVLLAPVITGCYFCIQFSITEISIMRALLLLLLLCDIWDSRGAHVNTVLNFHIYEGQEISWVDERLLAYKEHLSGEVVDQLDIIWSVWHNKGDMNMPMKENFEHTKRNGILSTAPNVMTHGKLLQKKNSRAREVGFVNMWTCRKQ